MSVPQPRTAGHDGPDDASDIDLIALVRSATAALAGDTAAAEGVELTLPETGVCGGSGGIDAAGTDDAGGCCAAPAQPVPLTIGAGRA